MTSSLYILAVFEKVYTPAEKFNEFLASIGSSSIPNNFSSSFPLFIVEGRRKQPSSRSRRHSSSAAYHKLDNNLEEAMGSNSNESVRHVIY